MGSLTGSQGEGGREGDRQGGRRKEEGGRGGGMDIHVHVWPRGSDKREGEYPPNV